MTGMPPATAASKFSATPFSSASLASLTPCLATSALLAVTTCLPALSAASTACLGNAVGAADQLDEHVDAGILGEGDRIVEPFDAGRVDAAVLALVARGYPDQFDRPAGALSEARFMRVKQVEQARADGAKAGDAQGERLLHGIARS